jgi:hypothetical protein
MRWTDKELMSCFTMPSGLTITGRSSSISNVFVAAIVPVIRPNAEEIRQVLEILELEPSSLSCSYCGDRSTEWDHLRPLVKGGRPTGFPSSIRNLVPSCGKCNQSKGRSDYETWMLGAAKRCPTKRGIGDVHIRIDRLKRYEAWAHCTQLHIDELVPRELLDEYYKLQSEILEDLRRAQVMASHISKEIKTRLTG